MNYWADTRIIFWESIPQCRAWVDKTFEDYFLLAFAESGSLLFAEGRKKPVEISGPVAWLAGPGQHLSFGWPKSDRSWNHRYVAFAGIGTHRYVERNLIDLRSQTLIPVRQAARFVSVFSQLFELIESDGEENPRAILLLEDLLLQLHEQKRHVADAESRYPAIERAISRMESHPERPVDFRQVASAVGYSYHHLRRVWKETTGLSPNAHLIELRLKNAAHRLARTNDPIKQIAFENGFTDLHYFNRLFSKRRGISPGRYRKELLVRNPS